MASMKHDAPATMRRHVLSELMADTGSDFGGFFSYARHRERWRCADVTCLGDERLCQAFLALRGLVEPMAGWSPELPTLANMQSFSSFYIGSDPERGRQLLGDEALHLSDCAHACLYRERRFVGLCIMARRSGDTYSRGELGLLDERLPELAERFDAANARESLQERRGRLLIHPSGRVELFGHRARVWLSEERRQRLCGYVAEQVRVGSSEATPPSLFLDGCLVELQRLSGPEGRVGYLAIIQRAPRPRLHPWALLTPRQREVAMYAASGATANEIARTMTIQPSTVRDHIKEIYRRLGIGSRVELSLLLRKQPPSEPDAS